MRRRTALLKRWGEGDPVHPSYQAADASLKRARMFIKLFGVPLDAIFCGTMTGAHVSPRPYRLIPTDNALSHVRFAFFDTTKELEDKLHEVMSEWQLAGRPLLGEIE